MKIAVDGFRNLHGIEIEFDPGTNLIIGPNGAGKSNILEAIYYLFYLRSFRNATEEEMIGFETDGFSLEGESDKKKAVVRIKEGKKKVILNGVEKKRYSNYAGWTHCVILSLSDIWIIRGSPAQRRNWLNSLLIRVSPGYYRQLIEYRTTLKQRNQLLMQRRADGELEAWTDRLVTIGNKIYEFRHWIFPEIKDMYQHLSTNLKLRSTINYQPSTGPELFRSDLERARPKELEIGQTLIGPHRDEIVIEKIRHNIKHYGSDGEQRLSGIILKIVESEIFKKEKKEPILLLDEPFIEIDQHFKEKIKDLVSHSGQSIMASTLDTYQGRKFRISGGRIEVAN